MEGQKSNTETKVYSKHHALKEIQGAKLGAEKGESARSMGVTRNSDIGKASGKGASADEFGDADIMTATVSDKTEDTEADGFANAAAASHRGEGGRHQEA